MNRKDLIGLEFGHLTVVSQLPGLPGWISVWLCRCACGATAEVRGGNLTSGNTRSCGCAHRQRGVVHPNTTHGDTSGGASPEYRTWCKIRARCLRPTDKSYPNYGGRGITVCERWRDSFENFLSDVGRRPPGMTIDRIDNDRGYEPGNVRWATRLTQARNRRSTRLSEADALAIESALVAGESQRKLASSYGVTRGAIQNIRRRIRTQRSRLDHAA